MDLFEYQAKELFADYDVPIPDGKVAHTAAEAREIAAGYAADGRPVVVIKVGTLDKPAEIMPQIAIFTIDKQPFHHIPDGMPAFERRPTQ